jgi:hypothetical protein
MTNLQIKKIITEATKGRDTFTVGVKVWHDGTEEEVFVEVWVYEGTPRIDDYRAETIEQVYLSDPLQDTPANTEIVKKEARKILKYLMKHYQYTTATEGEWL